MELISVSALLYTNYTTACFIALYQIYLLVKICVLIQPHQYVKLYSFWETICNYISTMMSIDRYISTFSPLQFKMLYFNWMISLWYFCTLYAYSWQRRTIPSDGNYAILKKIPAGTIPVEYIFPRYL